VEEEGGESDVRTYVMRGGSVGGIGAHIPDVIPGWGRIPSVLGLRKHWPAGCGIGWSGQVLPLMPSCGGQVKSVREKDGGSVLWQSHTLRQSRTRYTDIRTTGCCSLPAQTAARWLKCVGYECNNSKKFNNREINTQ
jgi:hypothetical protein